MDTFLFTIYVIAILLIPVFIVRYTLNTLEKSKFRRLAVVVTIIFCVVFSFLLLSLRFIPAAVNEYLIAGINITENKLNEISPGYTNQVLDKEKIKSILNDTKQMKHNLNEYTHDVSFITRIIGVNIYLSFFEDFVDGIDENILLFEQRNVPFTIHNILQLIQEKTYSKIEGIVGVTSLIVFVLSLIIYLLVILYVFAIKKRWIDIYSKSVVYGDNV